jgi:hypothetical protein
MAISALHYGRTVLQDGLATNAGAAKLRDSISKALKDIESLLNTYGGT